MTALCGNTVKQKRYPQSAYWPTPVNHYREFPKRTILLIALEGFLVMVELHIRLSLLACKYGCYNKAQLQGRVREGIIRHGQLTDISYVLVRIRVITSSDASTFCTLSDAHYDKLYLLFQVMYLLFATSTVFKSSYSKFSIRHGGIYFRVIKIRSNYNHFNLRLE